MSTKDHAREAAQIRALVRQFDHADLHLIGTALKGMSAVLEVNDLVDPSPDQRARIARMRYLATMMSDANAARDFIESRDGV